MNEAAMTIHFSPLLAPLYLYVMIGAAILLTALSALIYRRGLFWRSLCAGIFTLILLNPSLIEEERAPVNDVVIVVSDVSPSQDYGERTARAEEARTVLQERLEQIKGLEVRTVRAPQTAEGPVNKTELFGVLNQMLSDVPPGRRAGVIFLTDGQVHDIPQQRETMQDYGPVHTLLTGKRNEKDRHLVITEAPAYGIVGQTVTIRYRIEDTPNIEDNYATVISRLNDETAQTRRVPVNREQSMTVTIDHAGQNIIDLEASPVSDEITLANNRVPLIINGVRDRLRVLLVSGQPHAGGRTWRNILTSDPGVDLVHFTILREPDKLDATPQNELSLIAFPFRELFEVKLYDFDLIIFDRYRLNRILPNYYFENIAKYVKEGGALLEVSGPSYAGQDSIYNTALRGVLPSYPVGNVYNRPFMPETTETGALHPVTANLEWRAPKNEDGKWGPWLRHVQVRPLQGRTLMTGAEGQPLLMLDRVNKGRIAQLASDQIWLWARGYEGGGPHAELLRRLAHWLMKEPELEENLLDVTVDGNTLTIKRRTLDEDTMDVTLTRPGGVQETVTLNPSSEGMLRAKVKGRALGIYVVDDGTQKRFAVVGTLNPPEMRGVVTTPDRMAPLAQASGGTVQWLTDDPRPDIRYMNTNQQYGGKGWIGLRKNNAHTVQSVKDSPLLPSWLYALILMSVVLAAWWFEGRRKSQPV